jgi:hypothetical protein
MFSSSFVSGQKKVSEPSLSELHHWEKNFLTRRENDNFYEKKLRFLAVLWSRFMLIYTKPTFEKQTEINTGVRKNFSSDFDCHEIG